MAISIHEAQVSFQQYTDERYCGQSGQCYSEQPCHEHCQMLKQFIANHSKIQEQWKVICTKNKENNNG